MYSITCSSPSMTQRWPRVLSMSSSCGSNKRHCGRLSTHSTLRRLVTHQLSSMCLVRAMHYTIEDGDNAACIHLGHWHNETGMEEITLGYLHRFCLAHPEQLVAYVHTKGSYHNHAKNVQMRQFLLHSLASEECLDGVSNGTCSVCSARFAAAPQPHVPGNMWLARCDYVSRLVQPRSFGKLLAKSSNVVNSISLCRERGSPLRPHRVGTGRFASEHWINSHPTVSPCDTSARVDYQRGYGNIPPLTDPISLALAPRWPLRTIDGHRGSCNNPCKGVTVNMCSKQWQVAKWKDLYPDAVSSAQIELWKQGRLFADALGR